MKCGLEQLVVFKTQYCADCEHLFTAVHWDPLSSKPTAHVWGDFPIVPRALTDKTKK